MINLDDINLMHDLDPKNISVSLYHFTDQCKQGWNEVTKMEIPEFYKDFDHIDCYGMGGSRLGAMIASHVFRSEMNVNFDYYASYDIPAYVNEKTLAIIVSNSGTTEESLSSYNQAKAKTKKIIAITTGKTLKEYAERDGFPLYLIHDEELNPSRVPRVAVGFQLGAIFALLSRLNVISLEQKQLFDMLDEIKSKCSEVCLDVIDTEDNCAKKMAMKIQGKIPVLISSEHLFGAAKTINNQINESGKQFSCYFELPEVNHHQLEGMQFPSSNKENLIYLLFTSNLYYERNQKRYEILENMLKDLGIEYLHINSDMNTKLGQALEVVQMGSFMTYYLGLLNEVDPAPNPFVDKFKEQLGQPL